MDVIHAEHRALRRKRSLSETQYCNRCRRSPLTFDPSASSRANSYGTLVRHSPRRGDELRFIIFCDVNPCILNAGNNHVADRGFPTRIRNDETGLFEGGGKKYITCMSVLEINRSLKLDGIGVNSELLKLQTMQNVARKHA